MQKLAEELGITIGWFYGEPGHGRGVIDAMSSFGTKGPLRQRILATDDWFHDANEMCEFLNAYFAHDETKEHHLIEASTLAKQRRRKQPEPHPIKGCRKFHLIAVDSNGTFTTVPYIQDEKYIINLDFSSEDLQLPTDFDSFDSDGDDDDEEYELTPAEDIQESTLFKLIRPGSFVALRSPPNSVEPYYIAEVQEKGMAIENLRDNFGHCIVQGEQFATIRYLDRGSESLKKGTVKFQRQRKDADVFIHLAEILATNIELNESLTMKISEHQSILSQALL